MADTAHRSLHYVEVIYFNGTQFKERKMQHYPVDEAAVIFQRTCNKMKQEKINAMVCLREENHMLLKSDWLKTQGV